MQYDRDDIDYFQSSVRDSLFLMLWVSLATLFSVGIILFIAL